MMRAFLLQTVLIFHIEVNDYEKILSKYEDADNPHLHILAFSCDGMAASGSSAGLPVHSGKKYYC